MTTMNTTDPSIYDTGLGLPPGTTFETFELPVEGDVTLFGRAWVAEGATNALIILHGLGAHGGWFVDMGNALAKRGLNVFIVDHRGFGRSGGERGHVQTWKVFVADTIRFIEEVRRRRPTDKLWLLGHSMGGRFATFAAAERPDLLAGLLLLNPWVKDRLTPPPHIMAGYVVDMALRPKRRVSTPGGIENMTLSKDAQKLLEGDPLWMRAATVKFHLEQMKMRAGLFKKAAQVQLPVYIMQAENDLSLDKDAARTLLAKFPNKDRALKSYRGYDHDSEFQADRHEMDDDIARWINNRTSTRPAGR